MKYLFTFTIVLFTVVSYPDTLSVKQDGSGNFDSIQEAILYAWPGDTLLVWPGTYYENIDFLGKNITIASLMLTTGDESYRFSTIIDGHNSGSCVKVMSGETNAELFGFTIQQGTGTNFVHPVKLQGGGVIITNSSCVIKNCIITNNLSDGGGGIFCGYNAALFLSSTTITSNQSYGSGGGIMLVGDVICQFDSVFRCSLFLNFAERGCEFHKTNSVNAFTMYLDTCTVLQPDSYFVSSIDIHGYQKNDIIFNIQNHIITPKDADIYVNPVTGNNNNSGLTPDNPLQTIAYAYSSVAIDSSERNIIHLADGIYSDSAINEKYPLNIRPYINIVGESRDNTILDGMYKSLMLKGNNEVSNYSFSNLTMYRGGFIHPDEDIDQTGFAFLYIDNDNISFENVSFEIGHGYSYMGVFHVEASNNVTIKDCMFINNMGGYAVRTGSSNGDTVIISNCYFDNNLPDYNQPYVRGGAISIYSFDAPTVVKGCLFTNNNEDNVQTASSFSSSDTYFVNCTFAENTLQSKIRPLGSIDASLHLYNCIFYDNGGETTIGLSWNETTEPLSVDIYNSLIEGGEESIYIEPGPTSLHYDETNIDTDPLFYGGWEYPYNLSDDSPCIDAGTLDLPDWIEPLAFDLAGNPRIHNGKIDMGAYEWNPTVGVADYQLVIDIKEKLLNAAPNPFSHSTTLYVKHKKKADASIEIYNNYGQRVKILLDGTILPGTSQIKWNGEDDEGKQLESGVYHVIMFEDEKEMEFLKLIKIR